MERFMPSRGRSWLVGDDISNSNTYGLGRELNIAKRFADGSEPTDLDDPSQLCSTLHWLDYEGSDCAVGRLVGTPDLTMGQFGKLVEERFFLETNGELPNNHITLKYSSGCMAYIRITCDRAGNMSTRMTVYHPDEAGKPLFVAKVDEIRHCDRCLEPINGCACSGDYGFEQKNWALVFHRERRNSDGPWDCYKRLAEQATHGRFTVVSSVSVRVADKLSPFSETPNMTVLISFATKGDGLRDKRQRMLYNQMSQLSLTSTIGVSSSMDGLVTSPNTSGDDVTDVPDARMKKRTNGVTGKRKSFVCAVCNQAFPSNYKIDRHVRAVHLRERPFGCHLCTSKYYQKSDLSKHLKVRHGYSHNA